jgi:anti-sigma regulatory factor (Ser/Thr protein kinase)
VANASRSFPRQIDALDEIFAFVSEFTGQHDIDKRTEVTLYLVVEELFTNLVRHNKGGGDSIDLTLDRADGRLHLELVDVDVEPFDPASVAPVAIDAEIDDRMPGGLGVHLVRKMVDSLDYDYETDSRRMRVSVTTTLES